MNTVSARVEEAVIGHTLFVVLVIHLVRERHLLLVAWWEKPNLLTDEHSAEIGATIDAHFVNHSCERPSGVRTTGEAKDTDLVPFFV